MRLFVYILTIGILLISPQLRGQVINSYNVNAVLNVNSNSLEIKQIMKFKNTFCFKCHRVIIFVFNITNFRTVELDNFSNFDFHLSNYCVRLCQSGF